MSVYYIRIKRIRKWIEKYIIIEGDEMIDNYVNIVRRDFFFCVLRINRFIKFRVSFSWNLFYWMV